MIADLGGRGNRPKDFRAVCFFCRWYTIDITIKDNWELCTRRNTVATDKRSWCGDWKDVGRVTEW